MNQMNWPSCIMARTRSRVAYTAHRGADGPPGGAQSEATHPMRRIFVSRSSRLKPRPSQVRARRRRREANRRPLFESAATSAATVDAPAERPVNHRQTPRAASCSASRMAATGQQRSRPARWHEPRRNCEVLSGKRGVRQRKNWQWP
jgi:hypothetical protein